jgi:hypothetical protein
VSDSSALQGKGDPLLPTHVAAGLTRAISGVRLASPLDGPDEKPSAHVSKHNREIEMVDMPYHGDNGSVTLPHLGSENASAMGDSEGTGGDAMSVGSNATTFR